MVLPGMESARTHLRHVAGSSRPHLARSSSLKKKKKNRGGVGKSRSAATGVAVTARWVYSADLVARASSKVAWSRGARCPWKNHFRRAPKKRCRQERSSRRGDGAAVERSAVKKYLGRIRILANFELTWDGQIVSSCCTNDTTLILVLRRPP